MNPSSPSRHTAWYFKNGPQALLLVAVPLLIIGVMVGILLSLRNPSDEILGLVIGGGIVLAIGTTLVLFFLWGTVKCEIQLSDQGIEISPHKNSPLYAGLPFSVSWAEIKNISNDLTPGNNKYYIRIETTGLQGIFNLSLKGREAEQEDSALWTDLRARVETFNQQAGNATAPPIGSRGFYDTPGAAIMAIVIMVLTPVFLILPLFAGDDFPWWRSITFLVVGIPFVVGWINAKRRRRNSKG